MCYIRDIKTWWSKNSLTSFIYVWKDIWNNISQRWMINFLYHFYRFTRVSKLRYIPFWLAPSACFFYPAMTQLFFFLCGLQGPPSSENAVGMLWISFNCTVSFVKTGWKISRLLKHFNSLIIFFLKVGCKIAQLMFNLQSPQLGNFMSI